MTSYKYSHRLALLSALLVVICVAGTGVWFFGYAKTVMQHQIKERLETIAAAGALHIDGDDLDAIQDSRDMDTPVYRDLVMTLKGMQDLPDIRFSYILRKTDDANILAFVADADSLSTVRDLDINGNGIIDIDEEPSFPGEEYDITSNAALQGVAFTEPTTDSDVVYDKWGPTMSGYAPIRRRSTGEINAVLGIDMRADDYLAVSQSIFSPGALLFVLVSGVVVAAAIIVLWNRRQIAMLRKINSERSGLLKLTFHQLGEPLTIMKWSLETLREQTENEDLRRIVDEHVTCMDEGLGRLNSIIDTLQQAEKVDLNTLEYLPAPTSLDTVLKNAIAEWQSSLSARGQRIDLVLEANDIVFPFDRTMVGLVLRQLLQNAIEFSPKGGVITVRVERRRKGAAVSIEDRGCGIPRADMEHIFEKYRRAGNAHLMKPDGNGLGLYFTKGVVERAGGTIHIESKEHQGTKVVFTLPMGK